MIGHSGRGVERFSRPAAIAEHIEAAVPIRGQIDFDIDLGLRHQEHMAMFGRAGVGGNHVRGDDGEFETGQAQQLAARADRLSRGRRGAPIPELNRAAALRQKRRGE